MKTRKQQRGGKIHFALCGIVAFLAFVFCNLSFAEPRLELGAGFTKFRAREDGTWWQSQYETSNSLLSHSYMVGLSGLFPGQERNTYRLGWRIAYTRLGEFSGNNHATVRDEDIGAPADGSKCDRETAKGCMAWYQGSGKASGVSLGVTLERNVGPVVVSIEGGPFWFRSSYDVAQWRYQDSAAFPCVGAINEYHHATGDHLTWYTGIRARYGLLYLDYRSYHNVYEQGKGPGGDVGLTGGKTWQATAGLSVEF